METQNDRERNLGHQTGQRSGQRRQAEEIPGGAERRTDLAQMGH